MGEASWAKPLSFAKTFTGTRSALAAEGVVADAGYIVKALSSNTVPVFLGGDDVSTANGVELAASEWISVSGAKLAGLFGITGGTSAEVRVLKV